MELMGHMNSLWTDQHVVAILRHICGEDQDNRGGFSRDCMAALIRGCHEDKTLTAFSATLDPPPAIFDANWTRKIYFNLSDRERKRLRRFDNGIRRDALRPHAPVDSPKGAQERGARAGAAPRPAQLHARISGLFRRRRVTL